MEKTNLLNDKDVQKIRQLTLEWANEKKERRCAIVILGECDEKEKFLANAGTILGYNNLIIRLFKSLRKEMKGV